MKSNQNILCVLYDDPVDGMPLSYPRDSFPEVNCYPYGQTLPTPDNIDFTPGQLLGSVSEALDLKDFLKRSGRRFMKKEKKQDSQCAEINRQKIEGESPSSGKA